MKGILCFSAISNLIQIVVPRYWSGILIGSSLPGQIQRFQSWKPSVCYYWTLDHIECHGVPNLYTDVLIYVFDWKKVCEQGLLILHFQQEAVQ